MAEALVLQPPPAAWPSAPGRMPTVRQCLVLALLLHLLAVVIFGNVPGGTARPGEGVFGTLNIRLAGNGPPQEATPAPPAYTGPTGRGSTPRQGGTVRRDAPPTAAEEPGAAREGTYNPVPTARDADPLPPEPAPPLAPTLQELRAPADLPPTRAAEPLTSTPAAPQTLPPLPDLRLPEPAPLPAPTRTLRPAPAATAPAPPAALERTAPADAPATPALPPLPAPAALPPATRSLRAPAAAPVAPVAPAPPLERATPLQAPELPAAPAAPQALPPALRTLRPPPAAAPAPSTRALERTAPVDAAPLPVAPPLPAALPALPRTLPAAPAAAPLPTAPELPRVAPAEAPALPAAPSLPPAPQALPSPPQALPAAPPAAAPGPDLAAPGTQAPAPGAPVGDNANRSPRPAFGAPDAGANTGHDVAVPPAAAASTPRLNLDLVRPRGGELSRQGSRGVLNLLPTPPERNKLAEDIEKAAKPDCRTAYSGAGLLAVVPLAADALKKDGGCKW